MSIQAVAWALEQDLPGTAKLVLISLCNHADHVNGHCWPSTETIAKEASVGVRSVYRWIGALQRNDYIDVRKSKGKDGKQRANNYWIRFDRIKRPWEFFSKDTEAEPQDLDDPTANLSPGETTDEPVENSSDMHDLAVGPSDIGVTRQDSDSQTIKVEPSESELLATARARGAPKAFDPKARQAEQAKLQAAEEARSKNQRIPVVEGTDAWNAWVRHGHAPTLTTWVIFDGKQRRGWYFPSLFPPRSTGPPSDEFERIPISAFEAEYARG